MTSLAGFAVATRVMPSAPAIVRVPAGFLLALVFTSWTTYLVASGLSSHTENALKIGLIVSTLLGAVVLVKFGRSLRPRDLRLPFLDAAVGLFALGLSWWLIHARLREENGELLVSANAWSDTALHVALSRSFSAGANYPPEYPFFAGEPIRYHFGFDFFAGMLQEGGLSVLWSFNLPGIVGFTSMMLITFATARLLFSPEQKLRWYRDKGVWIGFVAVALLMTNQSLGWRRYLANDGQGSLLTALRPSVWWNHKDYLAVGPYTDDRIAIFNTPNAYLAQTHLIVAVAVVLLLAYVVLSQLRSGDRPSKRVLAGVGVTFGAAFWLNGVVWLAAAVFIGMLLVIWAIAASWRSHHEASERRWAAVLRPGVPWLMVGGSFALPALALGLPQAVMLNGGQTGGSLKMHFGYLVCSSSKFPCEGEEMNPLSLADWWSFLEYWALNEGVFIPLLILAFFLGTRRDKKIIAAVTCIFLWGSLFQVGADLGGHNHKVFNLWEALSGLFVAFAVVEIWLIGGRRLRRQVPGRFVTGALVRGSAVGLVGLLVLSGLIDFMTVKNDGTASVFGGTVERQATDWIVRETPPRATFLTDYDQLYTAPTMAGRGVALGYSPWASSSGYDVDPRKRMIEAIYSAPDRAAACALLEANKLDYVMFGLHERTSTRFDVNEVMFFEMNAAATFGSGETEARVYRVADNC